jgi:type II secretory pathway pseudopilin PulG
VEILVVIAIIGILMGIAIPAVTNGVRRARVTAMRLEIKSLEEAVEKYQLQYGDYPPDFSDWNVVQRHYRKTFPRMSPNEQELLYRLLHTGGGDGVITTKADNIFDAASLDRAEVITWTLGGYSKDIQRPFTGAGGPLAWVGSGSDSYAVPTISSPETTADQERQAVANYQINIDRPNALMEFDPRRLDYTEVNPALPMTGTNRRLSSDSDFFLNYLAGSDGAPFIYFDSRSYDSRSYDLFDPVIGDFNGYSSTTYGVARPYLSDVAVPNPTGAAYADFAAALNGWKFVNPNSFQIISAGLDRNFGGVGSFDVNGDSEDDPIYFQYPTGNAIALRKDVATPGALVVAGVNKYQESQFENSEHLGADNITNFTEGAIIDDVP